MSNNVQPEICSACVVAPPDINKYCCSVVESPETKSGSDNVTSTCYSSCVASPEVACHQSIGASQKSTCCSSFPVTEPVLDENCNLPLFCQVVKQENRQGVSEIAKFDETSCLSPSLPLPLHEELEGWPKLSQDSGALRTLFRTILEYLDGKDIKQARRVCAIWYHCITASDLFWKRFKVHQVGKEGPQDWSELLTSDLVSVFQASEYHFSGINFTLIDANLFLVTKSLTIKSLVLENCLMSSATLQLILSECLNLESLAIEGLGNCIAFSESIFPTQPKPNALKKLRKMKVSSNYARSWCRDPYHYQAIQANLHHNFLSELLAVSSSLETLTFAGWGSLTCSHVIQLILTNQCSFVRLSRLQFLNVNQSLLDFEHFQLLASPFARGLRLRKFSLTLHSVLPLHKAHIQANVANMVIANILKTHRTNLIALILDRCPVTIDVFVTELPRLRKLSMRSTQVARGNFGHLLPALQEFKHSQHYANFNPRLESVDPIVTEEIEASSIWDEPIRNDNSVDERGMGVILEFVDLQGSDQYIGHLETDIWRPLLAMVALMLPVGYLYVQCSYPDYGTMAYLFGGIVTVILLMAVKNYL